MSKQLKKEIVIAGYENAINLWIYSGQEVWARFNIMLSANAIIIAALTLIISENNPKQLFQIVLAVMGIILCICWGILNQRSNSFANYYTKSAREIEEKYLDNYISVVSRGCNFAEGDTVELKLGNEKKKLKIPCPANMFRAIHISTFIIFSFIFFYILVLIEYHIN